MKNMITVMATIKYYIILKKYIIIIIIYNSIFLIVDLHFMHANSNFSFSATLASFSSKTVVFYRMVQVQDYGNFTRYANVSLCTAKSFFYPLRPRV